MEDRDVKAKAYDKDSNGDKAAASAGRRAYAASAAADYNKAAASAARRTCAAIEALHRAKANDMDGGAHNKGSADNEAKASGARHAYATSSASDNNEAAASTVRRAFCLSFHYRY